MADLFNQKPEESTTTLSDAEIDELARQSLEVEKPSMSDAEIDELARQSLEVEKPKPIVAFEMPTEIKADEKAKSLLDKQYDAVSATKAEKARIEQTESEFPLDPKLTGLRVPKEAKLRELESKVSSGTGSEHAITKGFQDLIHKGATLWNKLFKENQIDVPPPSVETKDITQWYDRQTGTIKDIRQFLISELPEDDKDYLIKQHMSMYGVPVSDIEKGKFQGDVASVMYKADNLLGGMFGKLSTVARNAAFNNDTAIPPNLFPPELSAKINSQLSTGGSVLFGDFQANFDKGQTLDQAKQQLWTQLRAFARDAYFEATKIGVYELMGIPVLLGTAVVTTIPGVIGTAAKVAVAYGNPLSTLAEKAGGKLISSTLERGLVKSLGFTSGKVLTSIPVKAALSGAEGIIASVPEKEMETSDYVIPGLFGVGTHLTGEAIGAGVKWALRDEPTYQGQKNAVDIMKNQTPEVVDRYISGEIELPVHKKTTHDIVRGELKNIKSLKELAALTQEFNAMSAEEVYVNIPKNERMQKILDAYSGSNYGMNAKQLADQYALQRVAEDIDKKSEFAALLKTPEMKAALGDSEKVKAILDRADITESVGATANAFLKAREAISLDNVYRTSFRNLLKDISMAGQKKLEFLNITERDSKLFGNLVDMVDNAPDMKVTSDALIKNSYAVDQTKMRVSDALDGLRKQVYAELGGQGALHDTVGLPAHVQPIFTHIREAFSNETLLNPRYYKAALKDLAKEYPAAAALSNYLDAYNKEKSKEIKLKQVLINKQAKSMHINNATEARTRQQTEGHNLIRSAATSSNEKQVFARFSEHVNNLMLDQKVSPELKSDTMNLINVAAKHISEGKEIPAEVLTPYKTVLDLISGVPGVKSLKDLVSAISHWNKEVKALDAVRSATNDVPTTPDGMVAIAPAFRQASSDIITDVNLDRMFTQQAYLASLWADSMHGRALSELTKSQLFEYLFGGTDVRIKLAADPKVPFSTLTHANNLMRNTLLYAKDALDLVDELHTAAFGRKLDRDIFLSMIVNPNNFSNSGKELELLMLNKARMEGHHKLWKKHGDKFITYLVNTEMLEKSVMKSSFLAIGDALEAYAGGLRLSGHIFSDAFEDEINYILEMQQTKWAVSGFKDALNALEGVQNLTGLYETHFLSAKTGETKLTDTGKLHQYIFLNPDRLKQFKQLADVGDAEKGGQFIQRCLDELEITKVKGSNYPAHFFNYWKQKQFLGDLNDVTFWKNVWGAEGFLNQMRAKAYRIEGEWVAKRNEENEHTGVQLTQHEWREDFVHTKKFSGERAEDFIHDVRSMGDKLTDRFGSSTLGQLDKTKGMKLGLGIMAAEEQVVIDAQMRIRKAVIGHSEAKLHEHGLLLKDLGFEAQATMLADKLRQNVMGDAIVAWRELGRKYNLGRLPITRPLAVWAGPIMKGLGGTLPAVMLSRVWSMIKNITQQINSGVLHGRYRDAYKAPVNLYRALRLMFDKKYQPMGGAISLEGRLAVTDVATEYRDNTSFFKIKMISKLANMVKSKPILSEKIHKFLGLSEGMTKATKKGIAADIKINRMAEIVTENIKERSELGLSKMYLYHGAALYESVLSVIHKEGRVKAFDMLKAYMKTTPDVNIWRIVTDAENAIKNGSPYQSIREFLRLYHRNAVGMFGPMATPTAIAQISRVFPIGTRFFAARTNEIYRYGSGFIDVTEHAAKWVKRIGGGKTLPSAAGLRLFSVFAMGNALWLLGYFLEDGFPMPKSWRENKREEEDSWITKKLKHGFSVNLQQFSPLDYGALRSLAGDDIMSTISNVMSNFLGIGKGGVGMGSSIPFANAEFISFINTLKDINENVGGIPLLGAALPLKMDKLDKKLEGIEQKLADAKDTNTIETLRDSQRKTLDARRQLQLKYDEEWGRHLGDTLLRSFPITAWLAFGFNPLTWVLLKKDLQSTEATERAILRAAGREDFAGHWSTLLQWAGIQPHYQNDIDVSRQFFKWMAQPLKDHFGATDEQIQSMMDMALRIDQSLKDWDEYSNYLNKTKITPWEDEVGDVKSRVIKENKLPYKPSPAIEPPPSPSDVDALKEAPKNKPKPKASVRDFISGALFGKDEEVED